MCRTVISKTVYSPIFIVIVVLLSACFPGMCTSARHSNVGVVKTKLSPAPAVLNVYLQGVKKRIEHFWYPAKGSKAHATVALRINKDGRSYWVELTDASPVDAVNQSAEDAIFYSSPFPSLPSSFGDHLDLAVDFNSDFQPLYQLSYSRPIQSDLLGAQRLLTSAAAYSKQGKIEAAIELLKKASELNPFDVRVRDELIEAYLQLCQTKPNEAAISVMHQALLLDHNNIAARAKLNQLIAASAKDPQSFEVRVALARQYAKSSHLDDAVCEYGEAWLLKNDPQLIAEINTNCERRRKYADVRKWQAALQINDGPETHLALAQAYEGCGETDKALQEYRNASYTQSNSRSAEEAVQRLEAKKSEIVSEATPENQQLSLSDEFPYADFGSRSLSVKVIKDRKAAVDYLDAACGKKVTRWATNRIPLRVYVEDGTGVFGYRPPFRQFMIDAFATWVKASEGRLSFSVVPSPQQANIICHWVSNPAKGNMNNHEQGITRSKAFYHRNAPNILLVQSAEIFILTIYRGNDESLPDAAMKAVCLHELGHALGIAGHSPFQGDMMYATLSPYDIPLCLTDRDIGTIKRLYQGYLHPH